MTVLNEIDKYNGFNYDDFFASVTDSQILKIVQKDVLDQFDYLALLSPKAEKHIELMAQRAHQITIRNCGKNIVLFTPMYLANYCINQCRYCGFSVHTKIKRKKLSLEEVDKEAKAIADTGLKHLLILTGESIVHSPIAYIAGCVDVLKKYFPSIGIEVYPMDTNDYKELILHGVDGLTVYQEVYDKKAYSYLHPGGPKSNYQYRLDAPERGCQAGMRTVGIGALLGLDEWRQDAFLTGVHAEYLQKKYPEVEISISPPRMRPNAGGYSPRTIVNDINLVQYITAYRLFMPRSGITVSSRESRKMRNNLIRLGVTKMSAGVSTAVGGHTDKEQTGQFDISDNRSVPAMAEMIYNGGYQPVYKDWQ